MDLSTAGSQTQMYVRAKMQTIKCFHYFKYQEKVKLLVYTQLLFTREMVSLREIERKFSVITGTLKAYSISGTLII